MPLLRLFRSVAGFGFALAVGAAALAADRPAVIPFPTTKPRLVAAETMQRIYDEVKRRPLYIVGETVGDLPQITAPGAAHRDDRGSVEFDRFRHWLPVPFARGCACR